MRLAIFAAVLVLVGYSEAQTLKSIPEPQYIAVDSRDNVYVAIKYGIIRITPDGTVTNLTKIAGDPSNLDRNWKNLIVDSKDNLYANDGKLIFKFTFTRDGKFSGNLFAGQKWTYALEDGPLATAGFNTIDWMTIDRDDNIYVTDSYDKIKETIGANFVTDPHYDATPAKSRGHRNNRTIRKISRDGRVTTLKTPDGKFILVNNAFGITIDGSGNLLYASPEGRNVGSINLSTGQFSNVAGQPYKRQYCPVYKQGPIAAAELVTPENVIVNKNGDVIFADQRIHRIVKIAQGKVATLAGNSVIDPCSQNIGGRAQEGFKDGPAATALFNMPKGIAYDSKGNLYIADMYNHAVRKLSPNGVVSTFAK